jgi:hypothetical protein
MLPSVKAKVEQIADTYKTTYLSQFCAIPHLRRISELRNYKDHEACDSCRKLLCRKEVLARTILASDIIIQRKALFQVNKFVENASQRENIRLFAKRGRNFREEFRGTISHGSTRVLGVSWNSTFDFLGQSKICDLPDMFFLGEKN